MVKQVKTSENKFKNVFVKESDSEEARKVFLIEYLKLASDTYMSKCLKNIISGQALSLVDKERIDDLMVNVDLELLVVEAMLEGKYREDGTVDFKVVEENPEPRSDIEARIIKVMQNGKGKLGQWDDRFIFGKDGQSLLSQCRNRNGWLSEKQLLQLSRIEKILGIR